MSFALKKRMKNYLKLITFFNLIASTTFAFSVPDHKVITEIALEELRECQLLPAIISSQSDGGLRASKLIIDANADEDNYLKNGFKKLFVYSHFYNPLRPLKGEFQRANHADKAVEDYTVQLVKVLNNDHARGLKESGKIIHLIQDASSPLHVLWINHATADGFENKVKITKEEIIESKPSCRDISLGDLKSPKEILKAAGLSTMKELEELVEFEQIMADGSEPKITLSPWSRTFFSNSAAYTQKVYDFLREFNPAHPILSSPTLDDSNREGWDKRELGRGEYGPFSADISSPTIKGDNFGKTEITYSGNKIRVDMAQYKKLRKNLMRQAVLSTQRTLLWLNSVQ